MASLLDRITFSPKQCGGRPCVRGMRIRVIDVLDLFAAGLDAAQILDELPDLEPDDLKACLTFAIGDPFGREFGRCSASGLRSAVPLPFFLVLPGLVAFHRTATPPPPLRSVTTSVLIHGRIEYVW